MERQEAIEVIKKNYPHVEVSGTEFETAMRTLIPELAESEDEKIMKYLVNFVELNKGVNLPPEDADKMLAYLEKQGEQKPEIKYVYPKFRIGDVIVPKEPNGYFVPERVKYIGEGCYHCESDDRKSFTSFPICKEDEYKLVEQKPWKPTEKQLAALLTAISDEGNKGSDVAEVLIELYYSLKENVI